MKKKLLPSVQCSKTISVAVLMVCCIIGLISSASSQSVVEYLPGYSGELPFKLETGYVGVGEGQFFYYFLESEGDPENDPLMIWLTGGPGCSGLCGLVYQFGPMSFDLTDDDDDDGSIPRLIPNPYSWTKAASIILPDQPAGSGFSYATTRRAYNSSNTLNSENIYQFLRKWLLIHPKYIKNPLYIAGDSYAGLFVPQVLDKVYNGNDAGSEPLMNIKGYIEGNPATYIRLDYNAVYAYAHRMGLLSDKLFQSANENCRGDFYNPDNALCQKDMERMQECLERINIPQILERWCDPNWERERSLLETNPIKSPLSAKPSKQGCRFDNYILSYIWANNKSVRRALHVREGTIGEWVRCNESYSYAAKSVQTKVYKFDVDNVVPYHKTFTRRNCRALVYSGDHDMKVPHLGTEKWIESLKVPLQSDWRPWFVQGQTAGYTMRYARGDYNLTYVTVKGAGHTGPEYKPVECLAMMQRWLSYSDL